ncbi:MAG: YiiD C-terminal domain-containing protein [Ectothiorhodospiraceae bacterium]|nr:YiiD C-terminal domain-containing protein [Ectothiorhodospiraceae bacterium]
MDRDALEVYLLEQIPLARAMELRVDLASPGELTLSAPLEPNINHQGTVFGGSASAVAILSAWLLGTARVWEADLPGRAVIQRNTMRYDRPITGRFTATARAEDGEEAWRRALDALERGRKGRIRIVSVLACDGSPVGELQGDFVLLP